MVFWKIGGELTWVENTVRSLMFIWRRSLRVTFLRWYGVLFGTRSDLFSIVKLKGGIDYGDFD